MELNTETRELLEKIIDNVVGNIDRTVKLFLKTGSKEQLYIQNENDFVLGVIVGIIQQTFLPFFFSVHERIPNEQENSEITNVIFRKLAEVRDSIFKTG